MRYVEMPVEEAIRKCEKNAKFSLKCKIWKMTM